MYVCMTHKHLHKRTDIRSDRAKQRTNSPVTKYDIPMSFVYLKQNTQNRLVRAHIYVDM